MALSIPYSMGYKPFYAGSGARQRFSLRGGAGLGGGLSLRGGLGLGAGGGLGFGLGGGAGAGAGLALGGGSGSASSAFAVSRAVGGGGLGASNALVVSSESSAALAPILSRAAEKKMLSGLNNRFSPYMAKVQALQQENAELETSLSQLTGGTDVSQDSFCDTADYEATLENCRRTLETLIIDTVKLEIQCDNANGLVQELQAKLEFEQGVKLQLESDIAAMKNDIEFGADLKNDLDYKYNSLKDELDNVTRTQQEELIELQAQLKRMKMDTSMIKIDTEKSFDIFDALNKLREEYENTVQQIRDEAEEYYNRKIEEIQETNAKNSETMSIIKVDITAAKKELQPLNLELQGLQALKISLEERLAEAQAQSSVVQSEYEAQISSHTSAIEVAKAELQKCILAYQELLDIKLALDVEISTYRKILEENNLKETELTEPSYNFSACQVKVKEIITETSVISDADTESS